MNGDSMVFQVFEYIEAGQLHQDAKLVFRNQDETCLALEVWLDNDTKIKSKAWHLHMPGGEFDCSPVMGGLPDACYWAQGPGSAAGRHLWNGSGDTLLAQQHQRHSAGH